MTPLDLGPRSTEPARRGLPARLDAAVVATAVRTGVTPRTVVGLVLVLTLVLGVLGGRVALARTAARPVPVPPTSTVLAGPGVLPVDGGVAPPVPPTGPSTGSSTVPGVIPGTAGASTAALLVHLIGQVRHPGVVAVPPGARVQDAVRAAGGPRPGAALSALNLARPVVDGEQILVPRPGQSMPVAPPGAAVAPPGQPGVPGSGPLVDLNAATVEQLDTLPGVGPVLAGRILQWRTEHRRFRTVDELGEVSGIGPKVLERLRPLVRV